MYIYIYIYTDILIFPLIRAAPLGIHIDINASPLISAAPLTTALIGVVTLVTRDAALCLFQLKPSAVSSGAHLPDSFI